MSLEAIIFVILSVILLAIAALAVLFVYLWITDHKQNQHAILRNFPVLGKVRYLFEMIGPEFRQYFFDADNESKPYSRVDFLNVVLPSKYLNHVIPFGSKRDFDKEGYYIRNAMFPKQKTELAVDNSKLVPTKKYVIDKETITNRKEHVEAAAAQPWLLKEEDSIIIGPQRRHPFFVRGQIGMSGMSYGALGENAISALSEGIGIAGGSWMNTGEGGVSPYHLRGDTDIIMQIGPGLFGVRDTAGNFSWEKFKEKSENDQIKAFEIKLGQGAKIRGGHIEGIKVTPKIAEIRGVEPYKTVDSPNRFNEFHDLPSLFSFIEEMQQVGGKPVGIKIVVGSHDTVDELAQYMKNSRKGPDFITVDGGEGGTGATYQELADSVGLPIKSALLLLDKALRKHGVRNQVKIFASGKLFTPDRVAVALGMGADLVNIARGFMFSVGCINAQHCHTNKCPVGVATTDPELQRALVVDEKKYRVANYVIAMRKGLYNIAAAAGLDNPTQFAPQHIIFKDSYGRTLSVQELLDKEQAEREEKNHLVVM
ncbi:FMN-binding glutamate synthase family protein [Bacillus xiapuensis]|uniref:FMN-binding glutamate synthase family protein n=1 Tax=Bacillus xiapuensis TaxID=2014075 RepID=UPI000C24420B|nr:FMN-binding glutamate synthase family protein [Bacillus xiapuensis]